MSNLKRRRPRRKPKPIFYLFCEGTNTEPRYFEAVERAYPGVVVEIDRRTGVPKTVAEHAVECAQTAGIAFKSRKPKDSFAQRDEVWAVFDRDEHPGYQEAVKLCKKNNVGVACSDPCFELWLVLHERRYDAPCTSVAIQKVLGQLRPEYRRRGAKTVDSADMVKRLRVAQQRAETQLQDRCDEGEPYGNPSTTVGRLARAIRKANVAWRRRKR